MSIAKAAQLIISLTDEVSRPAKAMSAAIRGIHDQAAAISSRMANTGRGLAMASAQFVAFGAAVSQPIRTAMNFENSMADVRKVVDFPTPEAFQKMSADVLELSKRLPMAADGIAAIVAAAGQSGLENDELLPFAEMAAKVGVAWEVSADQAGEALAKLKTALGLSVADTGLLADAINNLGNNTAASAPAILDVVRRVAPMASQFGLSAEQAAAFGAAMVGAGFEAEVASTSFMNMGRSLTLGASASKRQQSALRALGLSSKNVAKAMQKDAIGTIQDVFDRLRAAPDHLRAALMSEIFGNEARALGPLITNAELLTDALDMIAERTEYAGSAHREYEERARTTANALQLLRNRVHAVSISFGRALLPSVQVGSEALGRIADAAAVFIDRNQRLVSTLTSAVGGFLALRVGALAGRYAILLLHREALLTAGTMLKVGAALKAVTVAPLLAGLAGARRALVGFAAAASISGTASAFGTAVAGMGRSAIGLLNPLRLAAVAARGLKVALMFTGVGAAIAAVAAGVTWLYSNFDGLTELVSGVGTGFEAALAPVMPAIRPAIDGIGRMAAAASNLLGPINASRETWRQWGVEIGEAVGGGVKSLVEFGQSAFQAVDAVAETFMALPKKVSDLGSSLYATGSEMVQSLWDGAVSKFNEFVEWIKSIPGRIRAAIGRIDLSSIVDWPRLPTWMGGSGPTPAAAASPAASPAVGSAPAPALPLAGERAGGGPIKAGLTYLVGEEGPELLTSNRDGNIVSNHKLGGGTTIAPVFNNHFHLHGRATKSDADELARTLDRQLRRSAEIGFGGLKPYGDE